MATVDFYSEMLQDPFVHELNGKHEDRMLELLSEIELQVKDQISMKFGELEDNSYEDGGAVDTVHNVYNGIDIKNKSAKNRLEYNKRTYNSKDFHNNREFNRKKREMHQAMKNGQSFTDEYTGKTLTNSKLTHLDHVIPGKRLSEDKGAALANILPADLANRDSNLAKTNAGINLKKSKKSNTEYVKDDIQRKEQVKKNLANLNLNDPKYDNKKVRDEGILNADDDMMLSREERARRAKNIEVSKTYYTSSQFWGDIEKATGKQTLKNMRSIALQMFLMDFAKIFLEEMRIYVIHWKDYVGKRLKKFKEVILRICDRMWKSVKQISKQFIQIFEQGFFSGLLSILATTLINVFGTTVEAVVRIINDGVVGLYSSVKTMIENPNHLNNKELVKQVLKIISVTVITSLGNILTEKLLIQLKPLGWISEPLALFLNAILTGLIMALCVFVINNMGNFFKNIKKHLKLPALSSRKNIKKLYLDTTNNVDNVYDELMNNIVTAYEKMKKLGDLSHDISLAAGVQLQNSVNYARYSGVREEKILHNNDETRKYFSD